MNDDPLLQEFLNEAFESLDRVDEELVALEADPSDRAILASVFRSIHSIKGACGFLEFSRLERVAHVGESLLSSLRDGLLDLDEPIASALLELVDAVRAMLQVIRETGAEGSAEYPELVQVLGELNRRRRSVETAPSTAGGSSEADVLAAFAALGGSAGAIDSPAAPVPTNARAERASASELLQPVGVNASTPPVASAKAASARVGGHDSGSSATSLMEPPVSAPSSAGGLLARPDTTDVREARAPRVETGNIRVSVEHLDRLMNMVGELVLARNQLLQGAARLADANTDTAVHRVNIITTELQESVMKVRMQPIGNLWSKFPRLVRDVARACGKEVELELRGKDTELDKTLLEAISDPLTHLLRNAIDHGIELPEVRNASGKSPTGKVSLRSYHESSQVVVEVVDDGKGLDFERIKEKAVARRLVTADKAATLTDRDVAQFIFHPGLSTADAVSNISGRGVGMDVVKTNIERIGGFVDVTSESGRGTTVKIKIPLTLAIIPALLVTVDGDRYAIPQVSLVELVRLEGEALARGIEWVQGQPVHRLRGQLLPLVDLRTELGLPSRLSERHVEYENACSIVVLKANDRRFGLIVDTINDTEEIVVKPLDRYLKGTQVYAGTTIMGDGCVALILDVMGVAKRANIAAEDSHASAAESDAPRAAATTTTTRLLVCDLAGGRRVAVDLGSVDRLEELERKLVESTGSGPVVQYRGSIMPLVSVAERVGAVVHEDLAHGDGRLQVVVHPGRGVPIGLVVGHVVDIIDARLDRRLPSKGAHVAFSAVVGGAVTDVLDVESVIADLGDLTTMHVETCSERTRQTTSRVEQICTFWVDDQLLGVDVMRVQEILRSAKRTRIPLACDMVEGLLNLRGQTVTALDLHECLGSSRLRTNRAGTPAAMNVVVRCKEGVTSLLVDRIGDVVEVDRDTAEPPPATVPKLAAALVERVHKLEGELLLVLDVDRVAGLAVAQPATA
jgi:two-component system chemotaxis sensor kinase CheA